MLSEAPVKIAVNMVPENERLRTPVKEYIARIKLRDDTGASADKPNRVYITEGGGVNQFYNFVVDFDKINLAELAEINPIVVQPYLFTNEEQLAGCINRILGTNLGKLDIIYDPIPIDAESVEINIDNRSLIYKGTFTVTLAEEDESIFVGVETTELYGFDDVHLPLN